MTSLLDKIERVNVKNKYGPLQTQQLHTLFCELYEALITLIFKRNLILKCKPGFDTCKSYA